MRTFLFTFTALIAPTLAYAGAPQCSIPPEPSSSVPAQASLASSVGRTQANAPTPISADQIERIPALRRIASKGAQLLDLGSEHGLRGVYARWGQTFQVFYLTPDGQAVIGGIMWEASGRNLTREQVTPIDGAIPTVTIGTPPPQTAEIPTDSSQGDAASAVPPATSLLTAAENTVSGSMGDTKAPKLWVYIDPLCSYSVQAMKQLKPYVAAARVQLAVIPLSVLDYEDQGRSTLAAKAMLSLPSSEMVDAWGANRLTGPADPAADARLLANTTSAKAIGLRGTPTFIWRGADGKENRADGLPGSLDALIASLGK